MGVTVDDEAFTALFSAHHGAVLAYARRRSDPETAQDVTAEVFVVAWRRLSAPPEQPLAWLLAVARRVLANEHRRSGRAALLQDRTTAAAATGGSPLAPTTAGDHAEDVAGAEHLREAMRRLTLRDQEVLQLAGWEELDHAEIATVLGCSSATARVRLHRARRRLRAVLERPPGPSGRPEPTRGPAPATSAAMTPAVPLGAAAPSTAPVKDSR